MQWQPTQFSKVPASARYSYVLSVGDKGCCTGIWPEANGMADARDRPCGEGDNVKSVKQGPTGWWARLLHEAPVK